MNVVQYETPELHGLEAKAQYSTDEADTAQRHPHVWSFGGKWEMGPLAILADALQDAGCDNDDILDHCRGPGPHVRGCWALDLVLALVEEDLGRKIAMEVARWLVLFLQRPGGQAQFSSHLETQLAERKPLRELQSWIADNLDADLRVESLAERASMSPRNFARFFRRETGMTPAAYVEVLRVERARQLLEEASDPVELVAAQCGFGTPETMRRAFARRVGSSPAEYRSRFRRNPTPVA